MVRRTLAAFLLSALATSPAAWAQDAAGKPAYVVVVDYAAGAETFEALKALVAGVAKASIGEPGCRRFDVVEPGTQPNHLLLYEIFDDAAAFQAHAASPHFKQFVLDSAKLGATRTATPGALLVTLQKP